MEKVICIMLKSQFSPKTTANRIHKIPATATSSSPRQYKSDSDFFKHLSWEVGAVGQRLKTQNESGFIPGSSIDVKKNIERKLQLLQKLYHVVKETG